MRKLALLLSLLALGALGLVACGGGGDDQTTAASETGTADDRTTGDALAADSKSCGAYSRWRLAVVEGVIGFLSTGGNSRSRSWSDGGFAAQP